MHILLVSAGGGGGNILRSVMATFRRDLAVTQKTDSGYAERLRRAVIPRFLDTNEFALSDLPSEALPQAFRLFCAHREQRPQGSGVEGFGECRRFGQVGAVHPQENADGRNGAHRHFTRETEPVELVAVR